MIRFQKESVNVTFAETAVYLVTQLFSPFKGFLSVRNYAMCVGRAQCRPKIKQTE